jgi:hypothetical protein
MAYGLKGLVLPKQDDEIVRRLALRYLRAVEPHNKWAEIAKKCIEMLEGGQWTAEEKAALRQMRRTALTLNAIAPLYRLVMGYQSSNRMDVSFLPTSDASSSEDVAEVLNNVYKSEANRCDLKFTDTDVFADGLSTGRGFWDIGLCFDDNELGEQKVVAKDPFSIFIDPDCQHYDLSDNDQGAGYIQESVWTNLDNINEHYGSDAAMAVQNVLSPTHHSSVLSYLGDQYVSPKTFFGGYAGDRDYASWSDVFYADFIDQQAKQIRLLDSQYKMMVMSPCFVDLETGDKEPIPDIWLKHRQAQDIIDKVLKHAEQLGNPLAVVNRPVKKVRRTITCGDILLFDKWSIYKDYTTVGFYPYFRRGATRGMIEDLIDPQREKNKKRSVLTDILNRNANSGWMHEEGTLDADQEENLRLHGAAPGINVKWKRNKEGASEPHRIEPGGYPQGLDRLEEKAADDMHAISGINESALGQLDKVQSGRAIEARQRQAVLSIQMYSDNFARSNKLKGRNCLSLYQNFYTEERVYRVLGEDSSLAKYEINKKQTLGDNAVKRLNDITVGKYSVTVDEVPISATFKQGQFEETMLIVEKLGALGAQLAMTNPGLIIDQTSLPRKQEWKKALEETAKAMSGAQGKDPKVRSAEKNETAITVAALNGVKNAGLVTAEMADIVAMARDAGAIPQDDGQEPPPPAAQQPPQGQPTPVGPEASTPEMVAG